MPKLVVIAPGNFAPSGGPEALHQLVDMANLIEPNSASICYHPFEQNWETPEPYRIYDCPKIKKNEIPQSALVLLPEIWPEMSREFSNKTALWWLSVDFFGSYGQHDISGISIHLAQSAYAYAHIRSIGVDNPMFLTDWLNIDPVQSENKCYDIAVNPAKGADLIDSFINLNKDLNVIKLSGMPKTDVINNLCNTKVYIDFGHHPGMDRIPREASMCNAVVFVKRAGAAVYEQDVPLDEGFKFDSVEQVSDKARQALSEYDYFVSGQSKYRAWCFNSRNKFKQEVLNLLSII